MSIDLPVACLNVAGVGMLAHIACSVWLRSRVSADDPMFVALFASRQVSAIAGRGFLMQMRFILPWVPAPTELSDYTLSTRVAFLGARIGGALFAIAMMALLLSVIYEGTQNA
jgi:hypothetical protein